MTLEDDSITYNGTGIDLPDVNGVTVESNRISGNHVSLHFEGANNVHVKGNLTMSGGPMIV